MVAIPDVIKEWISLSVIVGRYDLNISCDSMPPRKIFDAAFNVSTADVPITIDKT